MTTSGQVTYQPSALELIEGMFNILGIAQEGEALTPRMWQDGLRALNGLIQTYSAYPHLWTYKEGTLAMVGGQAGYALSDPKPLRITSVRRVNQGIQVPLTQFSRQEYFDQPTQTTSPSIPVNYYFDPQVNEGTMYLWPCPSVQAAAQYTLSLTYVRQMDIVTATNQTIDMPQQWVEPVMWNGAKRLLTQYPVGDPSLMQLILAQAAEYEARLLAWDNEPASINLQPDYAGLMYG
jgi:hypothetical protein